MKNKYNIVFYPTSKHVEFTAVAQQFKAFSNEYLLGKNSLPHLTLYQFEEEDSALDAIWQQAQESLSQTTICLRFDKINYVPVSNFYGLSLLPDNIEKLHELHGEVAKLLKLPVKTQYDPHLTLIISLNTDFETTMEEVAKTLVPIEDEFTLALGTSDDFGQFQKVIFNSALAPLVYK